MTGAWSTTIGGLDQADKSVALYAKLNRSTNGRFYGRTLEKFTRARDQMKKRIKA